MRQPSTFGKLVIITFATLLAGPLWAADVPQELAKPDGKPADQTKSVQVYILMGQSNMLGFGAVGPAGTKGTLETLVKEQGKYPFLVDDAGKWAVRQGVRDVHVMDQRGVDYRDMEKFGDVRNDWLSANKKMFGPELGFGYVMGQVRDEPTTVPRVESSCDGPWTDRECRWRGRRFQGYWW